MTEESSVNIGGIDYKVGAADGYGRRHLDVTGKHSAHVYPKLLLLEQLNDLRLKDLPSDLGITVNSPNTPLGIFESIALRTWHYPGNFSFTVYYSQESWRNPSNLWHHSKNLAGKLLANIEEARSAEVSRDQGCTWVSVEAQIPENTVIIDYVVTLEKQVENLMKQVERKIDHAQAISNNVTLKPDEKGLKWWLRYIIAPLLGGSGLIAFIKLAMGQA